METIDDINARIRNGTAAVLTEGGPDATHC